MEISTNGFYPKFKVLLVFRQLSILVFSFKFVCAEKLSESLRLSQSWPSVQAQVFLCFRVLLLKISQQHVTSLWPSVIAETVQVLSQLEHELRRETEEFR